MYRAVTTLGMTRGEVCLFLHGPAHVAALGVPVRDITPLAKRSRPDNHVSTHGLGKHPPAHRTRATLAAPSSAVHQQLQCRRCTLRPPLAARSAAPTPRTSRVTSHYCPPRQLVPASRRDTGQAQHLALARNGAELRLLDHPQVLRREARAAQTLREPRARLRAAGFWMHRSHGCPSQLRWRKLRSTAEPGPQVAGPARPTWEMASTAGRPSGCGLTMRSSEECAMAAWPRGGKGCNVQEVARAAAGRRRGGAWRQGRGQVWAAALAHAGFASGARAGAGVGGRTCRAGAPGKASRRRRRRPDSTDPWPASVHVSSSVPELARTTRSSCEGRSGRPGTGEGRLSVKAQAAAGRV
jgi:hypothetical protein